jgi:hypothetical protein
VVPLAKARKSRNMVSGCVKLIPANGGLGTTPRVPVK